MRYDISDHSITDRLNEYFRQVIKYDPTVGWCVGFVGAGPTD